MTRSSLCLCLCLSFSVAGSLVRFALAIARSDSRTLFLFLPPSLRLSGSLSPSISYIHSLSLFIYLSRSLCPLLPSLTLNLSSFLSFPSLRGFHFFPSSHGVLDNTPARTHTCIMSSLNDILPEGAAAIAAAMTGLTSLTSCNLRYKTPLSPVSRIAGK